MKQILIILLLFLIPIAQAEPLVTSYWGYVTVDGAPKTNAIVTVIDNSGKEVARATSTKEGYQVTVPWDDSTTTADEGVVEGETLTFKVDGKIATSKKIDQKGTNNRLELTLTGYSTTTTTSSKTTTLTTTSSPTATISPTSTSFKATTSPTATPEVTAVKAEKTEIPAPAATKKASGFGLVPAILGLMMVMLRKRG